MSASDIDDELFEQLEAEMEQDGTFDYYRQQQISQFQDTIKRHENLQKNFLMFSSEKELLETIGNNKKLTQYLILFINENFTTCQILVEKLRNVIERSEGRYSIYVIEATESPFLVSKLNIKVLPTMVAYINGKNVGEHVGLQGLLNNASDIHSLSDEKLDKLLETYFPRRKLNHSDRYEDEDED